jgi:uncharacterized membrane protein
MSFCQTCGSSLTDGSPACPACGASQGVAASSAAPGAMPGSVPPPPPAAMYAQPVAQPVQAGTGLTPNAAGALTYLLGLVTGIVFLVIEPYKNDRFVRFHAFQSIFVHVAFIVLWIVWLIVGGLLTAITHGLFIFILSPLSLIIMLGALCLWIYLMYTAYQGKTVQLPIIGALAASQAGIATAGTGQRL